LPGSRVVAEARFSNIGEYGLLVVLATLWGASYPLIKIALESIPPVTLMAVRVSLAAVILTAIAFARGYRFPGDAATWRAFLVQAVFNSAGAWTLLAWGQQCVDSGLAGVLNSTSPIFVFFLTLLWTRHEDAGVVRFGGALLGLLGIVIIVGANALSGLGQDVIAELAILGGALPYGCAAVYGKRFQDHAPVVTAAGTMIWATLILYPMGMLVEQPWTLQPTFRSACAAGALAVFSTAAALLIYFRLVKTIGSMGVASQSYLRSVIAIAMGVLFLGEPLSLSLAAGAAVIIAGMIMINGARRVRK
jgi:drug/metabolite transporter (DMT)-like permease